jgi:hypothetical protein
MQPQAGAREARSARFTCLPSQLRLSYSLSFYSGTPESERGRAKLAPLASLASLPNFGRSSVSVSNSAKDSRN